tara:strand:+ start:468 stop:638 length:171 start_codon:yes stop_codon:yes gene_type:complete
MTTKFVKYYVRIYKKDKKNESWQTLGPYDYDIATELMHNYLKKGVCCWVENVKFTK